MSEIAGPKRQILLLVSLAANLFLFGIVGGAFLITGHYPRHHTDHARLAAPLHTFVSPRQVFHALPDDTRKAVMKEARGRWREIEPYHAKIRMLRNEILNLLKSEEFDSKELEQRFDELFEAERNALQQSNALMLEMMELISVDDRRQIIDELIERERHRERIAKHLRGDPNHRFKRDSDVLKDEVPSQE